MWAGPCGSGAALEWEDSAAEALREDEMNWTVKPSSQQERNSSLYRKVLLSGALSSCCLASLGSWGLPGAVGSWWELVTAPPEAQPIRRAPGTHKSKLTCLR